MNQTLRIRPNRPWLRLLLAFLFAPAFAQGQSPVPVDEIKIDCSQLSYRPESDSVGRRASVDSTTSLMAGRWELVQINEGWGAPRRPYQFVELTLDRSGRGLVYSDGTLLDTFRLTLARRWNSIWFRIKQSKEPFLHFHLRPDQYGLLHVCDRGQSLSLSNARGDGTEFIFKRLPGPLLTNRNYARSVSAVLNEQLWYGKAVATQEDEKRQTCSFKRFVLSFGTDLPYDKNKPDLPVTGCADTCEMTQLLTLRYVPLAVGYYRVSVLDTCGQYGDRADYLQLAGGDAVVNTFRLLPNDRSWIEITKYDPGSGIIEGVFNLTFVGRASRTVRFQSGFFRTRLSKK